MPSADLAGAIGGIAGNECARDKWLYGLAIELTTADGLPKAVPLSPPGLPDSCTAALLQGTKREPLMACRAASLSPGRKPADATAAASTISWLPCVALPGVKHSDESGDALDDSGKTGCGWVAVTVSRSCEEVSASSTSKGSLLRPGTKASHELCTLRHRQMWGCHGIWWLKSDSGKGHLRRLAAHRQWGKYSFGAGADASNVPAHDLFDAARKVLKCCAAVCEAHWEPRRDPRPPSAVVSTVTRCRPQLSSAPLDDVLGLSACGCISGGLKLALHSFTCDRGCRPSSVQGLASMLETIEHPLANWRAPVYMPSPAIDRANFARNLASRYAA